MPRRLVAILGLLTVTLVAAAQPAVSDARYQVAAQAKLTIAVAGIEQKMEADAVFEYTWKAEGKVRTLLVDSAEVRAVTNGRELMNAKMSRAGLTETKNGKAKQIKADEAPDQLKRILTDSFGSPICKIELDDTGKEVKRTIVAGPGAATLIDSGMIANTRMFHPWFAADKNEWQAEMEVSTGSGVAKGPVTYTKAPGGKGVQAVKVAGTLTADRVKGMGGLLVKDGKYKVAGEQSYDLTRKEWVAGKLTLDISFTLTDGTKEIGDVKGTMLTTFSILPEKK